MRAVKLSTNRNISVFMTDSSDHVTGKTGLTLTITASKDGAAFGSISPVVTELASGWYKLALTTSHTDTLGDLALHITGTNADASDLLMQVVTDLPGASVSSVTGNVAGNVTGTVGSVVGAVGSVTGNVGGNVTGTVASVVGNVGGNVVGSTASVSGAVGSVTGAVGSVTGNVGGNVTGSVASVLGNVGGNVVGTVASVVGAVGSVTGNVGGNVTGTVASVVGNVGGNVVGSVASVTAGVTLAASAVQAIWDALTSALTSVGSIGKLIVTNLDALISSRLASGSYTAPDNTGITNIYSRLGAPAGASMSADIAAVKADTAAIKTKTDNLPASPASQGDVTTVGTAVAAISTTLGTPAGASVSADLAVITNKAQTIEALTLSQG